MDKIDIKAQSQEIKTNKNLLTLLGIIVTAIWILVVLSLQNNNLARLFELELNLFGDFLAGVFAPVAFLWLVLGYFMQGQELKQNTNALMLQYDELKQSVKHQESLATATHSEFELLKEQTEIDREIRDRSAQPMIAFIGGGGTLNPTQVRCSPRFRNFGEVATQIDISFETIPADYAAALNISPRELLVWDNVHNSDTHTINVLYTEAVQTKGCELFIFHFQYVDRYGRQKKLSFSSEFEDNGLLNNFRPYAG